MISRQAREIMRRGNERQEERHRGVGTGLMKMASQRVAETQVVHLGRLPCARNDVELQDADGNFLYMDGYSDSDGPDIGAPGGG